jgi:hypothetical protein
MSSVSGPEKPQFIEFWGPTFNAFRELAEYLLKHQREVGIFKSFTQREDGSPHEQLFSRGLQGYKERECVVVSANLLGMEMEGELIRGGLFTFLDQGGPNFVGIVINTNHPRFQELVDAPVNGAVLEDQDVITGVADAFIWAGQQLFLRQHLGKVGASQLEVESYFMRAQD